MKKLIALVFLVAIVALPVGVLAAPTTSVNDSYKKEKPKDRSVPEPSTMLLVGAAAAGLAGVRKLIRSRRG